MKRFLAAILAIALVVTGLYPTQYVDAATTTTTGEGLAFNTEEYGYYVADQALDVMPSKFEATVRLDNTTVTVDGTTSYKYWRTGVVFSNTDLETPGTFEFGFYTGNRPYVAFINDAGTRVEKIFSVKTEANHNSVFMTGDFLNIAIVNDTTNDKMTCYLDGEEWASVSGAYTDTLTPSLPACIGGDYREANTMSFKGSIKDVAIYDSESNLISEYELGLASNNAEYPETLEDLAGSYDMTRTRYHFMTEAEKEAVSPRPDYDFSMAVIGDPQVLTGHSIPEDTPGEVNKIFQWVADNAESKNIKFAFNMGDTTDSYRGSKTDEEYETQVNKEWDAGANAIKLLDNKVPYSIIRGNHDATDKYLENFSWADYSSKVSGSYADNMLNTYQKFEVEGIKYMVVNLDFGISSDATEADSILEWANNVVAQNPEYKVIVTTHAYMANDGSLMSDGESGDPTAYGMAKSGQDIWNEFVSQHENIVLALCGHMGTGEIMQNQMVGVHGNKVMQLLVNPQEIDAHFYDSGYGTMCGMVAMLYFSDGGKTVHAEYYSVLRDKYYSPTSQFSFELDSGSGLDFWTPEYDYYEGQKTFNETPMTFEATVKVTSEDVWIPAYIMANTDTSSGTALGEGFALGFGKGHVPQLVIVDEGTVTEYNFLQDPATHIYGDATYYHIFRGKRVHLAVVNDTTADKMYCYVNGELFATVDGAFTGTLDNAAPLVIGGDIRTQKSRSFKGSIKDIAIFSTARTAAEVQSDYTNGIAGTENGIMAAYEMGTDGTYAKTLTDLSGNDTMTRNKRLLSEEEKEAISPRGEYDYSMAVIGDPQVLVAHDRQGDSYAEGGDPFVDGQAARMFDWVVNNIESKNIKFAFNLGDTTDSYQGSKTDEEYAIQVDEEWDIGSAAVKKLDGKIPYSIVRGNHDATDKYTEHFAWADYSSKVSGSYEENMLNTYQKFEANGIKYMVVNLDLGVSDDSTKAYSILKWANDVVAANPDHNVIVTTHAYLDPDGTRIEDSDASSLIARYGMTKNGSDMWNEFISLHENIFMVLSGHRESTPIAMNESYGVHGNKIVEFMINAQGEDVMFNSNLFKKNDSDTFNTMTGNVAMLYFSNGGKTVKLEYYSTLWGKYYTEESQVSFDVNCIGEGQILNIKNGAVAIPYSMVDTTGDVPVPVSSEYQDYLFAGWYKGASCTIDTVITGSSEITDECYAKFIPKEILTVKAQVSTSKMTEGAQAGNWAFRFISSVESLDYKRVGFKVTYTDEYGDLQEKTSSVRTVYRKIASTESQVNCNFSPYIINEYSQYFITAKMAVADTNFAKGTDFTVQAYILTMDGTYVYGPKRIVSVNDGLSGSTLNTVIKGDFSGSGYTAQIISGQNADTERYNGEITVLPSDEGYTNVRIPVRVTNLNSASKLTIYDPDGNEVATQIYRNYYTSHESSSVDTNGYGVGYQDISWYHVENLVNPDTTEYTLASSADLYGLEAMAYSGVYFEGKTIKLISDIVINEGKATPGNGAAAPTWVDDDGKTYKWIPISKFAGTFDGQGHTISGVHIDNSTTKTGFFNVLSSGAQVLNLGIVNSYVKSNDKDYAGVLAGQSQAKLIKNVYSNAVIDCGNCTGGLVGLLEPASTDIECAFEQCWFDGEIYVSGYGGTGGGIAGYVYDAVGAKIRFSDCMFSGDIYKAGTANYPNYGGIVGDNPDKGKSTQFTFENCLNVGGMTKLKSTDGGGWGAIISYGSPWLQSGTMTNCYALENAVYGTSLTGGASSKLQSVNSGVVDRATLLFETETELFAKLPVLNGQTESAWVCDVVSNDTDRGTPLLKGFAEYWETLRYDTYDTRWYHENESVLTISTKEELFAMNLIAKRTDFAGKTIKLGADIVLNEGDAADWATTAPDNAWTPIAKFAGTFDGQGHTISGLYIEGTSAQTGFFNTLTGTAEVKNLGIVNSYITNSAYAGTGTVAGLSYAKRISNVYSDAIIVGGNRTGGIVGVISTDNVNADLVFEQCWFDGTIDVTGSGASGGGIVGFLWDGVGGTAQFNDCLFSGVINEQGTNNYPNWGGILGSNYDSGIATQINFNNCVNVGTMSSTHSTGGFGAICAYASSTKYTNSVGRNCYAVTSTAYQYMCPSGGELNFYDSEIVSRDELLLETEAKLLEKLPKLSGQKKSSWMCDTTGNDTDRGTPILKGFATLWMSSKPESLVDTRWYDEEETEYTIRTKEELYGFASVAASTNFAGKTIKLGADIVLNEGKAADWATTAPTYTWTPITTFAGTFDGQGHTISGVYIEGTSAQTGFFNTLTGTAEVKNLGIVNSYITNSAYAATGALAGLSYAKRILNVYSDAIIIGGNRTGGIVGVISTDNVNAELVLEQCWFDGTIDVTGRGESAGGIAGYIWDDVSRHIYFTDCLFSGELTDNGTYAYPNWGGIVGTTHASQAGSTTVTFENCLNVGIMSSAAHGTGGFGGICAYMNKGLTGSTGTNCYAVSGNAYSSVCPSGGDLTFTNYGVVARDTLILMTEADLLAKLPLLDGQTESAWVCDKVSDDTDRGTPILKGFEAYWAATNSGTYDARWYDESKDTYTISTKAELCAMNLISKRTDFAGKTIKLGADIVLNEGNAADWETEAPTYTWTPITTFAGTFDGQGHTISGVYINDTDGTAGFFRTLTATAEVCNVGIVNSYMNTNDKDYAGILAGHSYAKLIKNVYSDAIINCGNCTGGLIGMVQPSTTDTELVFEQCWFDGEIHVTGYGSSGGGLVGYIYDSVGGKLRFTDCLFSGALIEEGTYQWTNFGGILGSNRPANAGTSVTFENCLNVGTMTTTHNAGGFGGICAYMNVGLVASTGTNCWSVSGNAYTYNCPSGGELKFSNSDVVDKGTLLCTTEEEMFEFIPVLSGQSESAWKCDTASNDTDRGTPILKGFARIWTYKKNTQNQ